MLLKCLCPLLLVRAKRACDLCKNTWKWVFIITLQNSVKAMLPAVATLQNKSNKISILYKWLVTVENTVCWTHHLQIALISAPPHPPMLPQPKLKWWFTCKMQGEWNRVVQSPEFWWRGSQDAVSHAALSVLFARWFWRAGDGNGPESSDWSFPGGGI